MAENQANQNSQSPSGHPETPDLPNFLSGSERIPIVFDIDFDGQILDGQQGPRVNITNLGQSIGEMTGMRENSTFMNTIITQILNDFGNVRRPTTKKIASKHAIEQLKKVDVKDIPVTDRTCTICYDQFEETSLDSVVNFVKEFHDPDVLFPAAPTGTPFRAFDLNKEEVKESDNTKDDHTPVQMPCGHIFGRCCIVEWFSKSTSCPLCRKDVEGTYHPQGTNMTVRTTTMQPFAYIPVNWGSREQLLSDPAFPIPDVRMVRRNFRHGILNQAISNASRSSENDGTSVENAGINIGNNADAYGGDSFNIGTANSGNTTDTPNVMDSFNGVFRNNLGIGNMIMYGINGLSNLNNGDDESGTTTTTTTTTNNGNTITTTVINSSQYGSSQSGSRTGGPSRSNPRGNSSSYGYPYSRPGANNNGSGSD